MIPSRKTRNPQKAPNPPLNRYLFLIIFAAVLVRCIYVWQIKDLPSFTTPVGDEAAYHKTAQVILSGDIMAGKNVFYQDPFYPYYLAAVYKVFGNNIIVPKVIQLVIGAAACILVFAITRMLFGAPQAIIAGTLYSLYPLFYFFEAQLLKSSLVVVFTLLSFYLLILYNEKRNLKLLFISGFFLGLAIISQGHSYFYVPFIIFWLCGLDGISGKSRITIPALFIAGISVAIFPVAARNYSVSGEFIPTTYQAGTNFYIGNNNGASGVYQPLREGRELPPFEEIDAVELAQKEAGRKLSPSEVSAFWFSRSMHFILENPFKYAALTLKKGILYINNLEVSDVVDYYFIKDRSFLFKIPLMGFGLIFPLAVAAVLWGWKEKSKNTVLLYYFALASFLSVTFFYVFARYRLQGVPFFIILSAFAAVRLKSIYSKGRHLSLLAAIALLGVLIIASNIDTKITTPGLGYDTTASIYFDKKEYRKALEYYLAALAKKPNNIYIQAKLHMSAARCFFELRDYDNALHEYSNSRRLIMMKGPVDEEMLLEVESGLGLCYRIKKDYDKSRVIFESLKEKYPAKLDIRVSLGNVYKKMNFNDLAALEFTYVLNHDAMNLVALNNLANIYRDTGKYGIAEIYYRKCLQIDPSNQIVQKNIERLRNMKK